MIGFAFLIIQNFQYPVWIVVRLTRKHTVADILVNTVRKFAPNVYSVVWRSDFRLSSTSSALRRGERAPRRSRDERSS